MCRYGKPISIAASNNSRIAIRNNKSREVKMAGSDAHPFIFFRGPDHLPTLSLPSGVAYLDLAAALLQEVYRGVALLLHCVILP